MSFEINKPYLMLYASCLASKFGFNDGDAPEDWYDTDREGWHWHATLIELVREHLLPLIPDVEVYELDSIHNPIRATDDCKEFCEASSVEVEISYQQALAAFENAKARQ